MTLDSRISAAVEDLRRAATTDPTDGLARLRTTHRRRRTSRAVAVAVVLVLGVAASSWMLTRPGDRVDPVDPPNTLGNGALVSWSGTVVVIDGRLDHRPTRAERFPKLSFSRDGTELFYTSTDKRVVAFDHEAGAERDLGPCVGDPCLASVSPDGSAVAFGGKSIVVRDDEGERSIEAPDLFAMWPVWSPDGTRLAFTTRYGLYVVGVDGTGLRQVVALADEQYGITPSWSPRGDALVFLAGEDVGEQPPGENGIPRQAFTVTTVDLETGEQHELAPAGTCSCAGWPTPAVTWSPDGELVAFAKTGSHPGVFTVPATGGEVEQLLSSRIGTTLAWQPVLE